MFLIDRSKRAYSSSILNYVTCFASLIGTDGQRLSVSIECTMV